MRKVSCVRTWSQGRRKGPCCACGAAARSACNRSVRAALGLARVLARLRNLVRPRDAAHFSLGRSAGEFFRSLLFADSPGGRGSGIGMTTGFALHLELERATGEFRLAWPPGLDPLSAGEFLIDALNCFEQRLRLRNRPRVVLRAFRAMRLRLSADLALLARADVVGAATSLPQLVRQGLQLLFGLPLDRRGRAPFTISSSAAFKARFSDSVSPMRMPSKIRGTWRSSSIFLTRIGEQPPRVGCGAVVGCGACSPGTTSVIVRCIATGTGA